MRAEMLQLALRQLRDAFAKPRNLAVMAVVAVVLGLAGPFGTYSDFGLGPRVAYWVAIVYSTFAAGLFTTLAAAQLLRRSVSDTTVRATIGGALGGVPVTLVVMAINALAYGNAQTLHPLPLLAYCCAISAGVGLTLALFAPGQVDGGTEGVVSAQQADPGGDEAAPAAGPSDAGRPAILDRVPPAKRGALLALSVSDHYVDVITERGTTLVLMRLSDAIGETAGVEGLRIHRSHWVAVAAVKRAVREEGRVLLELSTGLRLPVSRGALSEVRARGLLR